MCGRPVPGNRRRAGDVGRHQGSRLRGHDEGDQREYRHGRQGRHGRDPGDVTAQPALAAMRMTGGLGLRRRVVLATGHGGSRHHAGRHVHARDAARVDRQDQLRPQQRRHRQERQMGTQAVAAKASHSARIALAAFKLP